MNWRAYGYEGFLYPFWRRRGRVGEARRVLRGITRGSRSMMRTGRPRTQRRWFCCCPVFFVLGLAGVSLTAGVLYLGIRMLGWA